MHTRYWTLIPIAFAGLLTACSPGVKPNAQPDWVLGQSSKYPASAYLSGRGQADNLAIAKDRARADLAKIFSVNVNEQTRDVSKFSQDAAGSARNSLDVSRNLSTRTHELLRGVEIADTWQDPQTGDFYALAVLSRLKTDTALRQQIADLDAGTKVYMNQAQSSNDLFARIAAATRAVQLQNTRAGLQQELQVVDITGRGIPPLWSLGQLQADRAALVKQLQISAAATGQDASTVQNILAGTLADAGFSVTGQAPYTMTANLNYANLAPRDDGWYWITGTLQVNLNGAGAAHGVHRWQLKVSATDPQLAHQRLMDQVARDLQSDIQATVLGFASGGGQVQ